MTIFYISLFIVVFILGFHLGVRYILKGLPSRVEQLHSEGDSRHAWMIQEVLKRYEEENR